MYRLENHLFRIRHISCPDYILTNCSRRIKKHPLVMQPEMIQENSEYAPFSFLNLQKSTIDGLQQYEQPVRQKQYLIFWSQKGGGWLQLDSIRLNLQDNTAYCISPNQVIQLAPTPEAAGYI